MKKFLFRLWQWTWGFPQSLVGLIVYLQNRNKPHFEYHGTVVTRWGKRGSMGVGMFLFLGDYTDPQREKQVLVHEFGHAVQSMILGPLFLIVMGIPSFLWANLKPCKRMREEKGVSYYSFYPEKNANFFGKLVTKENCQIK